MKHPPVGKSYRLGSASFQILAPETIEAEGSNNNSVAIKLTNKENSFIFTGDAEHESEKAMCNSGIDLNCDVLVPGNILGFPSENRTGICGDQLWER